MPTIRFLRPYAVQDTEGRRFAAGELLECTEATAGHFIRRQAAELLPAESAPEPTAAAAPNGENAAAAPAPRRSARKPKP